MKKLKDLKKEEIKAVYDKNDILKNISKEIFEGDSWYYIEEKLNILKKGLEDYNFGLYNYNNYYTLKDIDLMSMIKKYIYNFGCSAEVEEMIKNNKNEIDIFEKLIEEEILKSIKYIENIEEEEILKNFYEVIVEGFDAFYVNEEGILIEIKKYN